MVSLVIYFYILDNLPWWLYIFYLGLSLILSFLFGIHMCWYSFDGLAYPLYIILSFGVNDIWLTSRWLLMPWHSYEHWCIGDLIFSYSFECYWFDYTLILFMVLDWNVGSPLSMRTCTCTCGTCSFHIGDRTHIIVHALGCYWFYIWSTKHFHLGNLHFHY